MTSIGTPVSFIATSNAEMSRSFYEGLLELECVSDDPFALVFDLGGIPLRVQKVESIPKANHTVLGWEVGNIQATVEALTKKGIEFEKFSQLPQAVSYTHLTLPTILRV